MSSHIHGKEIIHNIAAEVEGALINESTTSQAVSNQKPPVYLGAPILSSTQVDLHQQHQQQHQQQVPESTIPSEHNHNAPDIPSRQSSSRYSSEPQTINNDNYNNNNNKGDLLNIPPSESKMESSTTTIAGSRDPTIKNEKLGLNTASDEHEHEGTSTDGGSTPPLDSDLDKEKRLAATVSNDGPEGPDESGVLTGAKLYLVFLSMMLTVFMFALDQSIVATAIPVIVSEFQAFSAVAWIITAYFLTQCGLILLVGQLLTALKAKWVLLGSIFFFELGSLLCAVATNMDFLIGARAVQGIGAAGMFVSLIAVIVTVTTLKQRPAFMAAFGFVFVVSSVVGPLLGGVFTEKVTWRWCFYINLPIGGIAAVAVVFLLPARDPARRKGSLTGWAAIKKLDYLGALLVISFVTCLLLALQWGGNDYAWGNWRIIFLFIFGGVLIIAFGAWQWYYDKNALMPLSLLKNRTQLAAMGGMFFFMTGMIGGTFQLPLYYQATRGRTPEQSGIDIIPFMLSVCVGIMISGGFVTKTGRYWPWLAIGPIPSIIGFGLLYSVDAYTPNPRLIGYQILAGVGIGFTFQNPLVAVQTEYNDRPSLIPQANGVVSFFQLTGAALGVGVINTVQSIFLNRELGSLSASGALQIPFEIIRQSPTAIYTLPESGRQPVIDAYTKAITESLLPIIISMGLGWIIGMFIRNRSTLGKKIEAVAA